jgi:dTMP kinase
VVLLDLDPADGLARRRGERDRIEVEDLAFHRRVRDAFRELAAADPGRFAVVDAAGPADRVAAEVLAAALARLEGTGEPRRGAPADREGP